MSGTPREIGTLIVIVLKARHLPNKRHIGKQAPYCAVIFNGDKRRTKTIHRGGQHPEWDEEIRFTLFEDLETEHAPGSGDSPPPVPPKNADATPRAKKIKGGTMLSLACFADDQREPELIGETTVDLTEVLTKGETDEWFTILNKDKYCGEVYLELTFWSNEKPPAIKKNAPRMSVTNPNYGGPGSFTPLAGSGQQAVTSDRPPEIAGGKGRISSGIHPPPSLLPSNSLARLNLYVPPYDRQDTERQQDQYGIDNITNSMAELGVMEPRRQSLSRINGQPSPYHDADPLGLPYSTSHRRLGEHDSFYSQSTISSTPSYHTYGSISSIRHQSSSETDYPANMHGSGYTRVEDNPSFYGGPDDYSWDNRQAVGSYIHSESHSAPLLSSQFEGRIPSPTFPVPGNPHYPSHGSSYYAGSLPDHTSLGPNQTPPRNVQCAYEQVPSCSQTSSHITHPPPPPPPLHMSEPNSNFTLPPNQAPAYRLSTPIPPQHLASQGSRPLPDPFSVNQRPLSRVTSLAQDRPPIVDSSGSIAGRRYGRPSLPPNMPPPPLTPPRVSPSSSFAVYPQPADTAPSHSMPSIPHNGFPSVPPPPPLPTTSFDFSTIPPPPPPPWEALRSNMQQPTPPSFPDHLNHTFSPSDRFNNIS